MNIHSAMQAKMYPQNLFVPLALALTLFSITG